MKILLFSEPRRPKPRVGDVKVVRGVKHVRQLRYTFDPMTQRRTQEVRNGRTLYEWIPA